MDKIIEFVKNNFELVICCAAGLIFLIIIICIISCKKKKARKQKSIVTNEEQVMLVEPIREEESSKNIEDSTQEKTKEPEKEIVEEKTRKVIGKFEIYQIGTVYRYHLKASNGEILVESELYNTKDGVINAIKSLQENVDLCDIKVWKDKKGVFQFKVFAGNQRVLATSANYSTETGAYSAIESFKRFAKEATFSELESGSGLFELFELEPVTPKQGGKVVLLNDAEGHYYNVIANNGAILCTSEDYSTKAGAVKGIDTLKRAIKDGKFYISKDKNENYQFKLYSASNRLIAVGETYTSKQQAKSSAMSLCNFIDQAEIIKK